MLNGQQVEWTAEHQLKITLACYTGRQRISLSQLNYLSLHGTGHRPLKLNAMENIQARLKNPAPNQQGFPVFFSPVALKVPIKVEKKKRKVSRFLEKRVKKEH